MSDFWDKQREKQNKEIADWSKPVYMPGSRPWWDSAVSVSSPVQQPQSHTDGTIDGHDVSKAGILKGDAEECPRCPVDPRTGIAGNMYRPSRTAAMRCFDCGFIAGRDMGEGQFRAAVAEGKAQKARQVASGGGIVHNYRGGRVVDRIG